MLKIEVRLVAIQKEIMEIRELRSFGKMHIQN